MDATSVRINAPLLDDYKSKLVRVSGKLEQYDGKHATLKSDGDIRLNLVTLSSSDVNMEINKNYEIIGQVADDLSVKVFSVIELSDNFSFENYSKLVSFVHKVPELFY